MEEGFDYPEESIFLNQAVVVEADAKISVYRLWFQDYSRETIARELESGGFSVESVWSDLAGAPYSEDCEWLGLITRILTTESV